MSEAKNLARYIESLSALLRESAEIGQMDSAVHADLLELQSELAAQLRKKLDTGVTA